MPAIDTIQLRRGTAAAWTAANPVLAAGEPGLETDTGNLKIGDGATAWNALGYRINTRLQQASLGYVRGDSYTSILSSRCTPGMEWMNLVAKTGAIRDHVTIGCGGTRLIEHFYAALATSTGGFNGIGGTGIPQPSSNVAALMSTGGPAVIIQCTPTLHAFPFASTALVSSGANVQAFVVNRYTPAGSTMLAVNPLTPNFAYPVGAVISMLPTFPTAGQPGVHILMLPENEYINTSATGAATPAAFTAGQLNTFMATLNSMLALLSSINRFEEPASATGWTQQAHAGGATAQTVAYSGGNTLFASTQNATFNYAGVTVPASGKLWALTYGFDPASGVGMSDVLWKVGATTVGSFLGQTAPTSYLLHKTSNSVGGPPAAGYPQVPVMVPLTGLTPGAATISATKTDATANFAFVDALFVPSPTPPLIVVALGPVPSSSGSAPTLTAGQVATVAANKATLDAAIKTVIAGFPNAITSDIGSICNPATDLSAVDGLHPNDLYMSKITRQLRSDIQSWIVTHDTAGLYATV